MRLRLSILIILSSITLLGFSQKLEFQKELNLTAKQINIDDLGNIYLINDYNIYKISPAGDTIGIHSTKRFGMISQFDVSIPQKPLILYKESGILMELDFTMSENPEPIKLFHEKLINPQFVIHSTLNNGYWIYDASKYELMHFDKNFQLEFSSGNILQLTSLKDFKPKQLIFDNNKLYLESEENGVLLFDQYAAFIKKIHLPTREGFFVENNTLLFIKGDTLTLSDDKLISVSVVKLPEKSSDIFFKNAKIYYLSTKGIKIYKLVPNEDK